MDDKVKDNRLSDVDLEKVSGGVQGNGDGTDWNDSDITGGVDIADATLIARFVAED